MRKFAAALAVMAGAGLLVAGCGSGGSQSAGTSASGQGSSSQSASSSGSCPVKTLQFAYPTESQTLLPFMIARDKGYFTADGLTVKFVRIHGAPQTVSTVDSGNVDVAYVGFDSVLSSEAKTHQLRYILQALDVLPYNLMGKSSIKSYADLKGKTVGTGGAGSTADTLLRIALTGRGHLTPGKDVSMVTVKGDNTRLTALETGQVAATILQPGVLTQEALAKGFRKIDYISNAAGNWGGEGVITSAATIKSKGCALSEFVKAVLKGIQVAHSNPQLAEQVYQKDLKMSAANAKVTYDAMISHFTVGGTWSTSGLQNSIDHFKTTQNLDPGTVSAIGDAQFLSQ